jgi:hypothetical protein
MEKRKTRGMSRAPASPASGEGSPGSPSSGHGSTGPLASPAQGRHRFRVGRLEQRRYVDACESLVPGETKIAPGTVEFLNRVFKVSA